MKTAHVVLALFLIGTLTALFNITGCGSPTSPAPTPTPAPTNTPCGFPGNTCTPTFTSTYTFTGTYTMTFTATNTPTVTNTKTLTFSPTITNTPTNTNTPTFTTSPTDTWTPSNTPTITMTATITNTPTNTLSPTITNTPTNTPLVTNTFTSTNTVCATNTNTPTPGTNGISFAGTASWTGTGSVSSSYPIFINAFVQNAGDSALHAQVTTSGGPYTIVGLASSTTYTLVAYYGNSSTYSWPPPAGVYAALYGTSTCNVANSTQEPSSGSVVGLNFSFGNSNQISAFSGAVNYSGSMGTVDQCHQIYILQFPAGTGISAIKSGATWNNDTHLNHNGNTFDMVSKDATNSVCNTQTADLLIFYDAAGTGSSSPQTGDPYTLLGSASSGTSATTDSASFDDTNIYSSFL